MEKYTGVYRIINSIVRMWSSL